MCSEADEIYKICNIIGSPTKDSWADGLNLARAINYQFPQVRFIYTDCFQYSGCLIPLDVLDVIWSILGP